MDGRHERPELNTDGDSPKPERSPAQRLESHVWRRMAAGFFVLIPLLITILILRLAIDFVDGYVRPLTFVSDRPWDVFGVGVLVALVAFYVTGALVSSRFGRKVVQWQTVVLGRVPVVKNIYGVAKEATDTLSGPMRHRFSRVVFLEWPRRGYMALGFVTGHFHSPVERKMLLVVYIPTVPNPTSGNLAFVPEEEIIETDLTVEDAMKVVFSGGIVMPEMMGVQTKVGLPGPSAD